MMIILVCSFIVSNVLSIMSNVFKLESILVLVLITSVISNFINNVTVGVVNVMCLFSVYFYCF